MKVYFTFSRGYAFVLCLFLVIAFSLLSIASGGKSQFSLENEAQRTSFLSRYGFRVGDPVTVKTVTVPLSFDEDYKSFNDTLLSFGYDLRDYKGKTLTEYTYSAADSLIIHILTDDKKIVGAVCLDLEQGSVHPLAGEKIGTDTSG